MTRTPVPMTITEAFRSLAEVMAKKTPEERQKFTKIAAGMTEKLYTAKAGNNVS